MVAHVCRECIEAEHGVPYVETVQSLVRAGDANGLVPLVGVPDNDRVWIR